MKTANLKPDKGGYFFTFAEFSRHPIVAAIGMRKLDAGFRSLTSPCAENAAGEGSVIENRKKFLGRLKIDSRDLVCLNQVHGSRVAVVGEIDRGSGALERATSIGDTDGAVSDTTGLPIAVFTADCFPIFFFDPRNKVAGICHAGWRGSAAAISSKVIGLMRSKFFSRPEDLLIAIGAGIRKCCYVVGEDLVDYFPGSIEHKRNGYHLDLVKENLGQLLSAGVDTNNIFDCELCTSCKNDIFFSYRKEKENAGRMLSVIMLK